MSHSNRLKPGPFDAAPAEDSAHRVSDPVPAQPEDFPPLSLLISETRAVPALLLRSFANTHRSAFDYPGFTVHMDADGLETVAGDFVQRATGHLYLVTVTPVVDPADLRDRLRSEQPLYQELSEILAEAEGFIAGFEDDEMQEGVAELLARMRRLMPGGLLHMSTEGMPR
ncbi:hypothetical protein C3942_00725 [Solimonas fluminis]|uniref:Uncharacterized protein n=1 Tax=Solimonas fluminis TaxID=2086571 RepID=A0A2S5TKI5_9GAMM|nr:hypothetical protein [Solimonas fluminis]PPE75452.1 hypothetical protein C3942_00725 [Solimonas fluminis]